MSDYKLSYTITIDLGESQHSEMKVYVAGDRRLTLDEVAESISSAVSLCQREVLSAMCANPERFPEVIFTGEPVWYGCYVCGRTEFRAYEEGYVPQCYDDDDDSLPMHGPMTRLNREPGEFWNRRQEGYGVMRENGADMRLWAGLANASRDEIIQ